MAQFPRQQTLSTPDPLQGVLAPQPPHATNLTQTRRERRMGFLHIEELPELFSDLTPIPQNDGEDNSICVIAYQKAFSTAYDYMRAVWNAKEFSGMCVLRA